MHMRGWRTAAHGPHVAHRLFGSMTFSWNVDPPTAQASGLRWQNCVACSICRASFASPERRRSLSQIGVCRGRGVWGGGPGEAVPELTRDRRGGVNHTRLGRQRRPGQGTPCAKTGGQRARRVGHGRAERNRRNGRTRTGTCGHGRGIRMSKGALAVLSRGGGPDQAGVLGGSP